MTLKDKIILIMLSIITLGVYPLLLFHKKEAQKSEKLSSAKKITVDIKRLQEALGGKDNVRGSEYTHTKIKIFLKSREDINLEDIKNIKGVSGVVANKVAITIIVGNQAKAVAKEL